MTVRQQTGRRQLLGPAAIEAAIAGGEAVRRVVVRRDAGAAALRLVERARRAGVPVDRVSPKSFQRLRRDGAEQEALGLVGPPTDATPLEVLRGDGISWQLAGVGYPGNAGAAVRTAEVSGAAGIFIDGLFDREQRRAVLRASMRADRFLPVFFGPAEPVLRTAQQCGRRIVAVEAVGDRAPWEVDLTGRVHLVVGGESSGVPDAILAASSAVVRIPMAGFVPCYNLQGAVAAIASERLRQLAVASG